MFGWVFISQSKGNVFKDFEDMTLLTMVVGTSKLGLTSKIATAKRFIKFHN